MPEQDLLPDAHLQVAAVQLVRDVAVLRAVVRDVGVQQVERDAAHPAPPHLRPHHPPGIRRRPRATGCAVALRTGSTRQVVEVVVRVRLLLPARRVQILPEIALLIEQPHAHQRHAQVAGRFQVVARQHPQAAGEDGQALGQPEFGGEVGHQQSVRTPEGALAPAQRPPIRAKSPQTRSRCARKESSGSGAPGASGRWRPACARGCARRSPTG